MYAGTAAASSECRLASCNPLYYEGVHPFNERRVQRFGQSGSALPASANVTGWVHLRSIEPSDTRSGALRPPIGYIIKWDSPGTTGKGLCV